MEKIITRRFRVYGIVQGVGFRPTASRHAETAGIRGTVCNRGSYVEILAQGTKEQVRRFARLLSEQPPRRAVLLKIDEKEVQDAPLFSSFEIVESEKTSGKIFISPDIAICEDCERELFDPGDRRYLHPFINCTSCGPRMTILEGLPYDRIRTSMKGFPMCPSCAAEYTDPASRRYDAQPVCCPDCGPEIALLGRPERGREALLAVRKCLTEGGIAAVKGIGGFHLCCDAGNPAAVQSLRTRKHRLSKPFAVMARDLKVLRRECISNKAQEEILTGHQKPILLLPKREGGRVCEQAAPGYRTLGVMLPYTPLHHLLFKYDDGLQTPDVLVMTSGNDSGAPICRDDDEALGELKPLCDLILTHNRDIRIRADDSVMAWFRGGPYMVRRSRGYAPLPFMISGDFHGNILAMGGELKNTFCVGKGNLLYLSPYVGDLEDVRANKAFEDTVKSFLSMLECEPQALACDPHPEYHSAALAVKWSREKGEIPEDDPWFLSDPEEGEYWKPVLPLYYVQHHKAHILSCMAENDYLQPVIGLSFDGTGYGDDGSIWGGEILVCSLNDCYRKAHIVPFRQVGGDASSRQGWRIAVSMIYDAVGHPEETAELAGEQLLGLCTKEQAEVICRMAEKRLNTVTSTSAGRLFDAVSAILGFCRESSYEGEAACLLQFAAEDWKEKAVQAEKSEKALREKILDDFRDVPLNSWEDGKNRIFLGSYVDCKGLQMATDELFRAILEKHLRGEDKGYLAYAFHVLLAAQAAECCRLLRLESKLNTVAVSGGVFQNLLFLEEMVSGLERQGFRVLTHHLVPPNDGGIALGQALLAAYKNH